MSTMAHSVLDGEVKFAAPIDSSSSSSASVLSRGSTSPLEDCLSRAFPYGLSDLNVEPLLPFLNRQQQLDAVDPTNFGGSGRSKLEDIGIYPTEQRQCNSVLGSKIQPKIPDFYSPFSQNLAFANNAAGVRAFSKVDHFKSELDYQNKLSQLSIDFMEGAMPDPLASQERRVMTMTERIQVPSSDHVAEIVGKNGQRIKQLREQLKVWVKTPSRDEPPIFEVTGLPEKLIEAKQIIVQMSDHFTKVQQERLARAEPNRLEDRLYVEQDKVGLIVGASGQTIRWVQQLSDTHIATPRKQESIPGLPPPQTFFTICGAKEKVKFAKQLICEYVTLRCQGLWLDPDLEQSAEASRLVREFHQRRQAADTQRRATPTQQQQQQVNSTAPVNLLAAAGLGRPLVGSGGLGLAMENDESVLGNSKLAAAKRATAGGLLVSDIKSLWSESNEAGGCSGVWDSMFGIQPDRRYSADSPSPLGPLIGGFGLDSSQLKKSMSDERVAPNANGWM